MLPGDVPFDEASPSLTHMAILALVLCGKCKFVVSQNVDGLHLRSGMDSAVLAELHGDIFQEKCESCGRVYFRNFDCGGCGFKATGRVCETDAGRLIDQVLDWEDALPERDYTLARKHSLLADVSFALGTSMRVHPAATIPLITVDKTQMKHSALSGVEEERNSFFFFFRLFGGFVLLILLRF
jgi:mono-ADP-ribosyltransferase sirtuin 6